MKNFKKVDNLQSFVNFGSAFYSCDKGSSTCQNCLDSGFNVDEKGRGWPCQLCMMGTLFQIKSSDHVEYDDHSVKELAIKLYGKFLESNNFSSNLLERKFMHFNKGDSATDVWHWFESTFNVSAIELDRQHNEQLSDQCN